MHQERYSRWLLVMPAPTKLHLKGLTDFAIANKCCRSLPRKRCVSVKLTRIPAQKNNTCQERLNARYQSLCFTAAITQFPVRCPVNVREAGSLFRTRVIKQRSA